MFNHKQDGISPIVRDIITALKKDFNHHARPHDHSSVYLTNDIILWFNKSKKRFTLSTTGGNEKPQRLRRFKPSEFSEVIAEYIEAKQVYRTEETGRLNQILRTPQTPENEKGQEDIRVINIGRGR